MNAFTDLFIRRPVLASVVSLLILLVGGMAAFRLQVRQFPETSNTTITITTTYPGAAADVIKGFITTPIEQAVASAEGIDTLVSTSQQNTSTITLNLRLDANPDRAMADTLSKVNQVRGLLPRDANDPVVVKQTGQGFALMYLSFNSEVMTPSQITDYLTRVVQPRLQTVDGVANAQILGGQTFAMRIWLDPTRMASLGVTPNDVRAALAANNFTTAAGEVKGDYTQISVNALTSLDSAKAFGQLVIATHGDALVRLGDVSKIELGPQSVDSSSVFDGLKAVFVGIYGTPEANPLTVIDGVRAIMPSIQSQLPTGLESHDRLQFDHLHPRLDLRGRQDARRSGGDRDRGDFPLSRQSAFDLHSDRHHSAFAHRRDDRADGARLFDQSAHAARAGARHRPRGRRRHCGGGEHSPPHRGGHDAVRRGDPGRARDRPADHRHDHHARRGLCADRLCLRRDRRSLSRIRLHSGGRRHRLGLHCADALADDVLEAAQPRKERRLVRAETRSAPSSAFAAPTSAASTARSTSAR